MAFAAAVCGAAEPLSARESGEDFEALWRAVDRGYAYFDARSRAAWNRARTTFRPRAEAAASRPEFVAVIESALEALRDDHVEISERSPHGTRRVPYDIDIWASWKDGVAVVEAVRTFGDADVAGLHAGQKVLRIGGTSISAAVRERLGERSSDARALDWGLRQTLAGPRNGTYRLDVRDARTASLAIEHASAPHANGPPVMGRRIGESRDIGYIRVRLGADDAHGTGAFSAALDSLRDTRALIVDLRDTAGPGSRQATLAILAHFAAAGTPWQSRKARDGTAAVDRTPTAAAPAYGAPVLVLVDRWTAGEAEALAAGLKAACGARLVGTASAGLRGELRSVRLPHSGLGVRFPGERVFLPDGTPREALRPDIPVDLAAPRGGPGDPILYEGLKQAELLAH